VLLLCFLLQEILKFCAWFFSNLILDSAEEGARELSTWAEEVDFYWRAVHVHMDVSLKLNCCRVWVCVLNNRAFSFVNCLLPVYCWATCFFWSEEIYAYLLSYRRWLCLDSSPSADNIVELFLPVSMYRIFTAPCFELHNSLVGKFSCLISVWHVNEFPNRLI
jgi:hypothetical protein